MSNSFDCRFAEIIRPIYDKAAALKADGDSLVTMTMSQRADAAQIV
ncbi:MAG: hypothetical protein AAFW97_12415 [Pseudomonadota bacterium]